MTTTKTKFFIVMDQMTVWGAGQTRESAIKDAAQWLTDPETGDQGCSEKYVESIECSEQESRNGGEGVFIYEVTDFDWPENAESLDGDQWCEYYYKQEKFNGDWVANK
ncbi:hypothetical protein [Bacterioplanoides sp.]|uniref:hypothetical protein n=1 Tax=Bacterioplanoides sp. TaxID=2066072 RepID=UPI003B5A8233